MRLSFRGSECEEELHSRELSSSMLGKKTMKKNGFATHLTGSNGLNRLSMKASIEKAQLREELERAPSIAAKSWEATFSSPTTTNGCTFLH
ncbi:hypothetical protein YC2023_060920 [Brassica napus]